jgi:hypothetical protein
MMGYGNKAAGKSLDVACIWVAGAECRVSFCPGETGPQLYPHFSGGCLRPGGTVDFTALFKIIEGRRWDSNA